jgi:hypothetical protein
MLVAIRFCMAFLFFHFSRTVQSFLSFSGGTISRRALPAP